MRGTSTNYEWPLHQNLKKRQSEAKKNAFVILARVNSLEQLGITKFSGEEARPKLYKNNHKNVLVIWLECRNLGAILGNKVPYKAKLSVVESNKS